MQQGGAVKFLQSKGPRQKVDFLMILSSKGYDRVIGEGKTHMKFPLKGTVILVSCSGSHKFLVREKRCPGETGTARRVGESEESFNEHLRGPIRKKELKEPPKILKKVGGLQGLENAECRPKSNSDEATPNLFKLSCRFARKKKKASLES